MSGKPALYLDAVHRLAAKALRSGGVPKSLTVTEWDISGRCESPVTLDLRSKPSAGHGMHRRLLGSDMWGETFYSARGQRYAAKRITVTKGSPAPYEVRLTAKCRRCPRCLAERAARWRYRAKAETAAAARTWFLTLTLSPTEQTLALARARMFARHRWGVDFDTLKPTEQFELQHRAIGPMITRYVKRVRKQSEAPLRFLCVAEAHKSGNPHYHMLVHEVSPNASVKYRVLTDQWRHGFSKAKLIEDGRAASYVTKYLAKGAMARVRASARYGQTALAIDAPLAGIVPPDPTSQTSLERSDHECARRVSDSVSEKQSVQSAGLSGAENEIASAPSETLATGEDAVGAFRRSLASAFGINGADVNVSHRAGSLTQSGD